SMRMKLSFAILIVGLAQLLHGQASPYVTLTGQIQGPNGLPAANANIELTPTQQFFVAGEGGNGYGVTSLTALSPIVATPSPIVDTGVLSYSTACGFEFWVWNGTAWACTTNVTATSTGLFLGNGATPGTLTFQGLDNEGTITLVNNEVNRSSNTVIQIPNPLSGNGVMVVNASSPLAIDAYGNMTIGAQYQKLRCESGLGDGYNAISAETYLQTFCYNDSGVTWTITGIKCFTDNSGSSTLSATDNLANALLTGAITCSSGFAAGTQSGTTTISSGGYIKFAFAADGTSKQTTWVVSFTQ